QVEGRRGRTGARCGRRVAGASQPARRDRAGEARSLSAALFRICPCRQRPPGAVGGAAAAGLTCAVSAHLFKPALPRLNPGVRTSYLDGSVIYVSEEHSRPLVDGHISADITAI